MKISSVLLCSVAAFALAVQGPAFADIDSGTAPSNGDADQARANAQGETAWSVEAAVGQSLMRTDDDGDDILDDGPGDQPDSMQSMSASS